MGKKDDKTNVMRLLDAKKLPYEHFSYDGGALDAVSVAEELGQDPACVFKTLVTSGASGGHYVFVIPGPKELDLKKAARAAGEKSIAMLPQRELLALTGYVHGGCSPIGMKKPFPTFIDASAEALPAICISAGRVGRQVKLSLAVLRSMLELPSAELTKE